MMQVDANVAGTVVVSFQCFRCAGKHVAGNEVFQLPVDWSLEIMHGDCRAFANNA